MIKSLLTDGKKPDRTVVRLTTNMYHTERGVFMQKSLQYLKRKSEGYCWIKEDCDMIGAGDVIPRIRNLNDCKDGVYEIVTINMSKDFETGYVEDWDYKLVPFEE